MSAGGYLFDSNVWIALTFTAHPAHAGAVEAFKATSRARPAHFCRATQLSFLRLATTPAILLKYGVPTMTNIDALQTFDAFHIHAHVAYRDEPKDIDPRWRKLASRHTASCNLWMDAYLAAFAMKADLTLVTTDAGFRQFEDLDAMVLMAK